MQHIQTKIQNNTVEKKIQNEDTNTNKKQPINTKHTNKHRNTKQMQNSYTKDTEIIRKKYEERNSVYFHVCVYFCISRGEVQDKVQK